MERNMAVQVANLLYKIEKCEDVVSEISLVDACDDNVVKGILSETVEKLNEYKEKLLTDLDGI